MFCPVVSIVLTKDEKMTLLEKGSDQVTDHLNFDFVGIELEILNNAAASVEYQFYVAATTLGKKTAYHKLVYRATKVFKNRLPMFQEALKPINIEINDMEDQIQKPQIYNYTSPVAIDEDGDKFTIELSLPKISCQCITIELNKNNSFSMHID